MDLAEWSVRRGIGIPTARLRLLPDFIVIGAQRSGTTSFFNYLCQHREIHASYPKETHYFSNYFRKGVYWYRSHFPLTFHKKKVEAGEKEKFITGEATPYYLPHPHAPRRVSELVPNVKLIALLRNPVDRAYSHYYHEVRIGVENLSFEEAIDKEEERVSGELELLLKNEHYRSFNFQNFSYLSRGIYIDQLESWLRYFDREQFLVLNSESFYEDPVNTIKLVTDFLDLPDWKPNVNKKYHQSHYSQMDSATRKRLLEYFEPYNQKLYDFLDVYPYWNSIKDSPDPLR
jgi:hypothetical protein